MKEFKHTVQDQLGLHARPAGQLVKKASQFSSDITVSLGSKNGDAKRIMSVMILGVKVGDDIVIRIEGSDEEAAEQELKSFLKENL